MRRLIYFLSVLIGSFIFLSLTTGFSTVTNIPPYMGGDIVLNCNNNIIINETIRLNDSSNVYIVGSGGSINFTTNSGISGDLGNLIVKNTGCTINMPRKYKFQFIPCWIGAVGGLSGGSYKFLGCSNSYCEKPNGPGVDYCYPYYTNMTTIACQCICGGAPCDGE